MFELSLRDTTGDGAVTIGFKSNSDAIADNLQPLVDAYNDALGTASGKPDGGGDAPDGIGDKSGSGNANNRLYRDMAALSRDQRLSLGKIGLLVNADASISIDREALSDAISPERATDTFETLSSFRDAVGDQAQSISVNPMHYVNKIIIVYKNPGHNFATPYISSLFSGMMMDEYV
jgi:flagellar hook-associated protein 2